MLNNLITDPHPSLFIGSGLKNPSRNGFSLIELLVVLAITAIMALLAIPALASLGKSTSLDVSTNVVQNLVNLGRETAMSKNSMTALIVATDPNVTGTDRAFVLLELDPRSDGSAPQPADWKQVSQWEVLNSGIVCDPSCLSFNKSTDSIGTAGVPLPGFPPILFNGNAVTDFSYVIFLPGGNLLGEASPQIQLVEGGVNSGAVTYTRVSPAGGPANYCTLTILASTGRVKIDRP